MKNKQRWYRILSLVLIFAMLLPSFAFAAPQEAVQEIAENTAEEVQTAKPATRADTSLPADAKASAQSQLHSLGNTGDYEAATNAAVTHELPKGKMPEGFLAPDPSKGTLMQFVDGAPECSYTWVHNPTTTSPTQIGGGVLAGTVGDGVGSDLQIKTTSQSIGHTIVATDIVEVRIKPKSANPAEPRGCQLFWSLPTALTGFSSTRCVNSSEKLDLASPEYQVITFKIGEYSGAAGTVIGGFRFDIDSAVQVEYEIDYIYIGAPENAPSTYQDYVFYDFAGDAADLARYKSSAYAGNGTNNDDKGNWYIKNCSAAAVTDANLVLTYAGSGTAYIRPTSGGAAATGSENAMNYTCNQDGVFMIRMKTTGTATSILINLQYYNGTKWVNSEDKTCAVVADTYLTAKIDLSSVQSQIKGLQIEFHNVADGTIVVDWIYMGPEEKAPVHDNLYFDFTSPNTILPRYTSKTYNNKNFDNAGSWTHRGGTMNADAVSATAPGTLSSTLLATATEGTTSPYNHYLRAQNLGYVPSAGDYLQIRMKVDGIESSIAGDTFSIGAIFYYNTQNGCYASQYESVPQSMADKGYFTVTIPLKDAITSLLTISELRLQFNYLAPIAGKTGTITIDYAYVGPKDMLPVQDFLYFDFENTQADKDRYATKTYGGVNYDVGSWHTNHTYFTAPAIDNDLGVLSFSNTEACSTTKKDHQIITSTTHSFSGGHSLQYTPNGNDYFAVRMKIEESPDTAITLRMMYAINGVSGSENNGGKTYAIPASAVNEGYFVVSDLMPEQFRNANEANAIRVEVYNLTGAGGDTIVNYSIDYIYVGPQEYLPNTNGDALFIDYRNDDAAKARYASDIYGGLNFDLVGNYNSFSTTNIEQVTTSGIGNLVMKNTDRGAAFAQTTNGAIVDRYPLHFRPEVDDVVQMRFKVSGASTVSAYVFYGFDDHMIVSNDTCFAQDTVDDAYIRQGQYFILNIELEDAVTHAAKLTSLRPHFTFTETTGVTVNLDYIYVGPQESAPYSYQAKRTLSSTDTSGENYRIRYEIDFFKPTACGRIRVNELLQQEFELYDRDDKSFGADAIKVYKKAYSNKGNYVDDLVAMPASSVYSKSVTGGTGEQKQITLYLNDGDNAYRRDNYGDTVAGYRYVLNINFRVDHDATMGGNGVLVNQLQKSWTKFQKKVDGTFSSTLTELFNYKEETLNVAFAKPVGHDFFMELYDTDSGAEDFTTAANAIDNKFEDNDNMFSLDTYATYRDNMLSAGRKLDLIEYLNYEKADGNADRGENMIFANTLTNIGDGITNKYTRVNYWVMFNDGDMVVDLAYDQKARLYREIVPWEADKVESIDRRPVWLSRDELPYFDPTEDQVLTVRAFYVPKETEGTDSLGREYYKDYLQDIRTNKETYVTYYAPKFAVVDYGRTVSVNMRMEGQQIGTWDVAQDETGGVEYEYGFHILSTNGQLDEHLANIKYNFRKSFMDDSSRFLLEDTAVIYYLTRSRNGEKGTEKRTIASFEPEVKALHEGTGIEYDMNLDQYYDEEQNSITCTFGDATESPKALEGLYYTTMRQVTIIPANNIYYDMDKFYRESRWASDGKLESDLQAHDYEDEYASPYGYDPNWYANASDGEPNNHSWGRAWKTTASTESNNARANFTFYGTGFEIISHTLSTTGVIIVEVYSGSKYSAIGDDTNLVRRFLVDTYHADGNLYQIPIVVCNDLPYGQYTVRARAYYHNIFDHHYTIETTSTEQQKRSTPMAVTEENIRSILGLSEDSPLTFIPSESGYPKITRGVTVKYQGYYDAYLDGFRIYNPMDDVITEKEYPLEYYAYKLSDEINTAGTETRTEFYNLKNDLLLDRSTWKGNDANGILYLGDGSTQVEQNEQAGSFEGSEYALRLGMEGTLDMKADHLFFDFTDTPYDAGRYDDPVYGGLNYDVEGWHYNYQHDTPISYDAENGTVSFSKIANEAARSIHTIITSSNGSYSSGHPLSYIPGENDCFEIRMKIEGSPDTTADFRLKFAKDSDNSSEHVAYSCAIPSEYINNGSFFTLSGNLNTLFTDAERITAIRPEVGNLTMPANSTGLTITIDYIYVGPDRSTDAEKNGYLADVNGSYLASDCHGARISVSSGKFYCECSERHELTGNRLLAVGHRHLVNNTGASFRSVCHNAPISYAYTYNSSTGNVSHHYFCECDSYHHMQNGQLLASGVSSYDDKYEIDGPQNELYLKNGSGVAFDVGTSDHIQISLKAVNKKNVELWAYNGTTMESTGISTQINVEMYYDLPSKYIIGGSVYLMCKSSDSSAMMSLCNLKVFDGSKPTVKAGLAVRAQKIFAQLNEPLDEALNFSVDITAGAQMAVNYTVIGEKLASYKDFYLVIEKYDANGKPVMTTYGLGDGRVPMTVIGNGIMYTATYEGINAKEMGDRFSATLYAVAEDGKIYRSNTVENSIKDFLLGKINDPASILEMKTMAVDMLKYGAAAQVRFDYDAENLVTASLSAEQLAYATEGTPIAADHYAVTGDGANVSANITVNSKVELNLSCIAIGLQDPDRVKCIVTDADGKVLSELEAINMSDLMFSAKYDNVGARQMRKVICATFVDADGNAISKTVHWSVESYVAQTRANTDATENEIAMVNAMLVYGDSVAAYMSAQEAK